MIPSILVLSGCGIWITAADRAAWDVHYGDRAGWIEVAAVAFAMGSPEDEVGHDDVEDLHSVVLTHDYVIAASEVTWQRFFDVLGYGTSRTAECGVDCPVVDVTWHQAADYANTVSASEGRSPCYTCTNPGIEEVDCELDPTWISAYDCPGYRLPTEAEWEMAARAGATAAFPGGGEVPAGSGSSCDAPIVLSNGDVLGDFAWYCGNAEMSSHVVGSLDPNRWGLYDMLGNVAEWTNDAWQGEQALEDATDPWWTGGANVVIRGGSWWDGPEGVRLAGRSGLLRESVEMTLGFRLARTLDGTDTGGDR